VALTATPARRVKRVIAGNGGGFDMSKANDFVHRGHYGLAGIRERVQNAGGTWTMESSAQEGTRLTATVPCQELPPVLKNGALRKHPTGTCFPQLDPGAAAASAFPSA
jgi:signal transduction histidine kinase